MRRNQQLPELKYTDLKKNPTAEECLLAQQFQSRVASMGRKTGLAFKQCVVNFGGKGFFSMDGDTIYAEAGAIRDYNDVLDFLIAHETAHKFFGNDAKLLFVLIGLLHQNTASFRSSCETNLDQARREEQVRSVNNSDIYDRCQSLSKKLKAGYDYLKKSKAKDFDSLKLAEWGGASPGRWKDFCKDLRENVCGKDRLIEITPFSAIPQLAKNTQPTQHKPSRKSPGHIEMLLEIEQHCVDVLKYKRKILHANEYLCDEYAIYHTRKPLQAIACLERMKKSTTTRDSETETHPTFLHRIQRVRNLLSQPRESSFTL